MRRGSTPNGYTGREPDETGLVYYRARYYDPAIGRFTQRDPIGLKGGVNQYTYVGSNPVNLNDPTGLLAESSWTNSYTQTTSYYGSGTTLQSLGLNAGSQSLSTVGGGLWEQTATGSDLWTPDLAMVAGPAVPPKSNLNPDVINYINKVSQYAENANTKYPGCPVSVQIMQSGWENQYEKRLSYNNYFGAQWPGDQGLREAGGDKKVKLGVYSTPQAAFNTYCAKAAEAGIEFHNDRQFLTDVTKTFNFAGGNRSEPARQEDYINGIMKMIWRYRDYLNK